MCAWRYSGYTLLEFLVTMLVVCIMATIGVPSFLDLINKHRLKGATESIYGDLQLARMEAIKRNKNITISFHEGGYQDWCYAMHDGSGCDCNVLNNCRLDNHYSRIISGLEFHNVGLETNFSSDSTSFNPVRGTSNSGSILLTMKQKASKVIVSSRGRIRICSDDLTSYPAC
jgi:prepilin-type N-terminal cleavage/methylation domain-containing protein